CACQGGPPPPGPRGRPAPGALGTAPPLAAGPAPGPRGANPPKPNSRITGTGPVAPAGVVNVSWMATGIGGQGGLATCPMRCFVPAGVSPLLPSVVLVTSHFTLGVSAGTRP